MTMNDLTINCIKQVILRNIFLFLLFHVIIGGILYLMEIKEEFTSLVMDEALLKEMTFMVSMWLWSKILEFDFSTSQKQNGTV